RDLIADRVEWSQQLEVLFGLQPGEFSGSREEFLQFIHPADREAYVQGIQKAIESRTDYVVEFRFYTRDGRLRWMEGRGRAFYDRSGRPVRLAGIGVDITERKLVEQKLRDMNEELRWFASAASHDIKEPLRMVSMYVQLLERKYKDQLDADGLQFIRFAKDGALRMGQLIDALLAYSQAGRSDLLQTQGVDSGLALAAALANLAPAIDEAEAVVTFDDLPRVVADEVHVTQLFQNLIGNALKYRGKVAPVVHVRGQQVAGEYVFSVSDNGIGIAEEDQSRIFGVFQRLHGREYAGAGIGLATCRKIVEAYCGRIWVESIPGKGSTFFFTLPAAERVKESAAS
ncbi:MAG TPA: ATP-binding protein, partial [Bryobacteraceae bacterium]|nr:ATP-binding protein [Bryobacteraceae bacterium]